MGIIKGESVGVEAITIDRKSFRDKVAACWMGKNIGGTLGLPYECDLSAHSLTFYDPLPSESAANDDLDLQLVWLSMLEQEGLDPALPHFVEYWRRYASAFPWNEYGMFMRNVERGLAAPIAGCFENYFVDEMGAPIRSEIWGCLHAGDPQNAARIAWKDAVLDHAGGEGVYGEMFWAALQAAAFVESDPDTLIRIGLSMIPLSSHIARAIREAVWCRDNGVRWSDARERIRVRFANIQPCNAVPNHAFTILGWLYGEDFGDCLCKAVNCGYDTDCTGATLGATLGIVGGMSSIPERWSAPIGKEIVLHKFTRGLDAPGDIDELTDRGLPLAVLSNKPDFAVRQVMDAFLDKWSFVAAHGHVDGIGLKPDPTTALQIAAGAGIDAGQWLYMGDTEVDMQTARAAQMHAVGVLWGFRDESVLRESGGQTIIAHPLQALDLL